MNVGTLVNWRKQMTHPPNPEILTIPAIVNQIWPDGKTISLFVFDFNGAFLARTVPMTEVDVVADSEELRSMLEHGPGAFASQRNDLTALKDLVTGLEARVLDLETQPTKGKRP